MTATERSMLDLIHARYGRVMNGASPRYIVAEQVRLDPTWAGTIADAVAVDTWGSGDYGLHGFEVKISRGDWLRELRCDKAGPWMSLCRQWWLVVPDRTLVKPGELPPGWGMLAGIGNLRLVVEAPIQDPEPLPARTMASLMRATAATSARRAAA